MGRRGAGGGSSMSRIEHYNDPEAPKANSLVPAASAVVVDGQGRILLHRRDDNQLWSIPGGAMEPGESIGQTVVREVKEETGLDVEPESIIGVYSNPRHVVEYADGEVRQQFSVCFVCKAVGGQLTTSNESLEVGFFTPAEIESMPMHDSIRLRIRHYLERPPTAVIA
jgi:ADP-ribose pyrophosphatase YjhB (NUDIX family)